MQHDQEHRTQAEKKLQSDTQQTDAATAATYNNPDSSQACIPKEIKLLLVYNHTCLNIHSYSTML